MLDGNCLRCEQNADLAASLETDKKKSTNVDPVVSVPVSPYKDLSQLPSTSTSSDENPSILPLTADEVRIARLNHFNPPPSRNHNRPVRFRHSIGSPSLIHRSTSTVSSSSDSSYPLAHIEHLEAFGDIEVESFVENFNVAPADVIVYEDAVDDYNEGDFLQELHGEFNRVNRIDRHVIIQRDLSRFWEVIFKQSFDLSKQKIKIRFAGEPGADAGGPYREFLTLCMKHFPLLSDLFFAADTALCFKAAPEKIMRDYYSRFQAIEQFKNEMKSVSSTLVLPENFNKVKRFMLYNQVGMVLYDFMLLCNIIHNGESGSNERRASDAAACEFEMFIAEVSNGDINGITLYDILFYFTGFDRLPPYGLHKQIDITFDADLQLPKISTCGYTVVLPISNVPSSLETALRYDGGYGVV